MVKKIETLSLLNLSTLSKTQPPKLKMASTSSSSTILPTRSNGGGISPPLSVEIPPLSATTFEEIPMSLPAARHRDVMNETRTERIKNDLAEYKYELQSLLVRTMDSKRFIFSDIPGREEMLAKIHNEEVRISAKIDAITLIINSM